MRFSARVTRLWTRRDNEEAENLARDSALRQEGGERFAREENAH